MTSGERPWSAAAAFGHPLFLCALAVLVLNDHVFKHTELIPHAITGKLSDFAGLIVAPAVLAWHLRARDRSRWIAAHAIIFAIFAVLELSPALVSLLERASLAIGAPVRMWADPTDLAALPALAISFVVFGPERHARESKHAPIVGAIALVACAATSAPTPPVRYPFAPGGVIAMDVYLRNPYAEDLVVRVRRLNDSAQVDCATLLETPERAIDDDDFGEHTAWLLRRGDALPLWDRMHDAPDRACYAVILWAHDREWLFVWAHGTPPMRDVEIARDASEAEPSAVVLAPDRDPIGPEGIFVRRR